MGNKIFYSCVLDGKPIFYYQAWVLVNSLVSLANARPEEIFVHCTPTVAPEIKSEFNSLGVNIIDIIPFGDKKYCNKIVQLETKELLNAECVIFFDTDMIVLEPLHHLYHEGKISGKVVDKPNPSIEILTQIFNEAQLVLPEKVKTDCTDEYTFKSNINGGLYAIPTTLMPTIAAHWKKWALWLLDNIDILEAANKTAHVDQVSFALTCQELAVPIHHLTRLDNFPLHLPIPKVGQPKVIHFHKEISKTGLIVLPSNTSLDFKERIDKANTLIGARFNNKLFWSYRYDQHPELGSGVGSRGDNLIYKRNLLKSLTIEDAPSVLDIGCGDMKLLDDFNFQTYTGVDVSPIAIQNAKDRRPGDTFILFDGKDFSRIPSAHTVLCFEVLIHQDSSENFYKLISLLVEKTTHRLIVSGFEKVPDNLKHNHMISFFEPLSSILERSGKFSAISSIGQHTTVEIFLAEV